MLKIIFQTGSTVITPFDSFMNTFVLKAGEGFSLTYPARKGLMLIAYIFVCKKSLTGSTTNKNVLQNFATFVKKLLDERLSHLVADCIKYCSFIIYGSSKQAIAFEKHDTLFSGTFVSSRRAYFAEIKRTSNRIRFPKFPH